MKPATYHREFRWVALALVLAPAIALCTDGTPGAPATPAPQLRAVRAAVDGPAVTMTLEVAGAFEFTPAAAGPRLLLVDLPGVGTAEPSTSRLVDSPLVSSYRTVSYLREGKASVRVEILLKAGAAVDYRRSEGKLEVRLTPAGAAPAPSAAAKPAGRPASRLEKVDVSRGLENSRVALTADGALEFHTFELRNPYRLVLDIAKVRNASKVTSLGESALLKDVRVGQFKPEVTRVVLEMADTARYEVRRGANGMEIEVTSRVAAAPARKEAPVVAAAAASSSPKMLLRPPKGASATPAALPQPPAAASLRDLMPSSVEAVFASMRQLSASPKVELAAQPEQQPARPVALLMPRNAPPEPPATQAPNAPRQQQAQPAPAGQAVVGQGGKRYTGEIISINVKDVDLKDFFRLIHEISGLNVILDANVRGPLTMVLDEVPWDQALDIVLRNFQLDSVLEGNVLRIATLDTLKREQQALADLAKAQQDTVERITVARTVSYAKATDLATTLKRFLSPRSEIIADERTNQLIVTDIPQSIPTMDEVLKQLDKRTPQVEIEARVVAASREFVREIGSQFGFAASTRSRATAFAGNPVGANNSPLSSRLFQPPLSIAGGQAIPLFSNFPAAGANTGFIITHDSANLALDLILTAAERRGVGKIISRPRIVTQSNRQARVQQGAKIPIQTTVNNTVSVQFQDVTLAMRVTPQITAEDTVFLEIDVENAAIDPGVARINGIPALSTQQAQTRVLVKDGATIVFGGVIANENTLTIQQVPLLGSVPLIGNLFKRTGVNTRTSELLFFVTPKIV